jgi:hypothetical protein
MWNRLFITLAAILLITGCGNPASDDDRDYLTLGTGIGHGKVTGSGDVFVLTSGSNHVLIHWALESKHDIGGGLFLAMLIEQKTGDQWIERRLYEYTPLTETEVYFVIDSFDHQFGTGTFRATAISGIRKVASRQYTVSLE